MYSFILAGLALKTVYNDIIIEPDNLEEYYLLHKTENIE